MRGLKKAAPAVIGVSVLALTLGACGGDSGSGDGGDSARYVTVNGSEPQNPLIPAATNETGGGNVIDNMFTGLVTYNQETAAPENAVATSIESADQQVWDITIRDDWTFQDGTPVTASSFVDAWNWAAYGPNAALNSYFFEPIEGFADVQGEFDDEGNPVGKPKAKEMSGLEVVSDTEFKVTLSRPNSQFPVMVGYSGFAPMPTSFFDDPEAFGDNPVGNGPFQFESQDPKVSIKLKAWPDYPGDTKPSIPGVEFKIYQDLDAAWADLQAGNLDVLDTIPDSGLAGGQYKSVLGDRVVEQAAGVIQTVSFPIYEKKFDNPELRKAISMAIDRQQIIDNVFNGTREPATGWVSPVVNGYKAGVCGESCNFDPTKAKEMFDQAGGFDGKLTLAYNADGGHKGWVDATCVSISNALGVDCVGKPTPDFATFRTEVVNKEMTGMFRTGWQMDYPSIENFLTPLYKTGASANDGDWSNADFDRLVEEAAALPGQDGIAKFQEAEGVLAQDMPVIPMWYGSVVAGYSDTVSNVQFTPFSRVNLLTIQNA
ncbi:MAG: ABC transporter substrate-binding protein [Candidatus Nanopelagicales bacterium]|jgi:oligopeptide transport system substrate-binding protein